MSGEKDESCSLPDYLGHLTPRWLPAEAKQIVYLELF